MLNLLNNSADAIRDLNEKWIRIEVTSNQGNARILVIDSGNGIPPEIIERMMQPFFSTKEVGKGTGLGLSISKGIIDSHRGRLYYAVTSQNTCFVIELPLIA